MCSIIAIHNVYHERVTGYDNHAYGTMIDNNTNIQYPVKLRLHCWNRYDNRVMMANEIKKLFGFKSVELYRYDQYIVSLYHSGDITLDNVNYNGISNRLRNHIRATFALRICMGMRVNTEKSIVIRGEEPYCIEDKFPKSDKYNRDYTPILSNYIQDRWFNRLEVEKHVQYFPIWTHSCNEDKLQILSRLNITIMNVTMKWGCPYLHNYLIGNIKRGLLID